MWQFNSLEEAKLYRAGYAEQLLGYFRNGGAAG